MAQIEVPLTQEQLAALEALARRRRISVSRLLQEQVASLVRSALTPADRQKRLRALAAAGRFRSRSGDLAKRRDEVFADAADE